MKFKHSWQQASLARGNILYTSMASGFKEQTGISRTKWYLNKQRSKDSSCSPSSCSQLIESRAAQWNQPEARQWVRSQLAKQLIKIQFTARKSNQVVSTLTQKERKANQWSWRSHSLVQYSSQRWDWRLGVHNLPQQHSQYLHKRQKQLNTSIWTQWTTPASGSSVAPHCSWSASSSDII